MLKLYQYILSIWVIFRKQNKYDFHAVWCEKLFSSFILYLLSYSVFVLFLWWNNMLTLRIFFFDLLVDLHLVSLETNLKIILDPKSKSFKDIEAQQKIKYSQKILYLWMFEKFNFTPAELLEPSFNQKIKR